MHRQETTSERVQRRKGPDPLLAMLPWICGLGWLLLVVAFTLGGSAKPDQVTVIERWHEKAVETAWNMVELGWMLRLGIGSFCLSLVGMLVNSRRLKRKHDEFRINLILLCLLSLVLVAWYLGVAY